MKVYNIFLSAAVVFFLPGVSHAQFGLGNALPEVAPAREAQREDAKNIIDFHLLRFPLHYTL